MAEILEALPNLGGLSLLVELTGSCPTFSGGNCACLASEKLFEPLGLFWVLSLVELWLTFFGEPKFILDYFLHSRAIGTSLSSV